MFLDRSGRLALLSSITGEALCFFEPPGLETHVQHIGAFTGDVGKYIATAHDSVVLIWSLENEKAMLHARVQSHTSTLRQVRHVVASVQCLAAVGTPLGEGCLIMRLGAAYLQLLRATPTLMRASRQRQLSLAMLRISSKG